jgi:hypothetical protein
MSLASKT